MAVQKVAIYTRVSTDAQAEGEFNSCEAQATKIKAFLFSQEDMELHKIYSDAGYSGAYLARPALSELRRDIQSGLVNTVIVYKIDRLTRSPKDFYQIIEEFEKHSVSFISVTERFDTATPAGRLLRNIMLTFAQFERELTSERTRDKLHERAKQGLYGGGFPPYGYKRVAKKLVAEPAEAQIAQKIFEKYIETGSLAETYQNLKAKGVTNRHGKPFSKGELANLLRNPIRIGKLSHRGALYSGVHEPIIREELFSHAQQVHKQEPSLRYTPAKDFLLPGMVQCKECESVMTPAFTNKLRNGKRKRYYYYRCTSTYKRDWNSCTTRCVSATRLDKLVVESLSRICGDKQYVESLSFMLGQKSNGPTVGLEPSAIAPAITGEMIKESLANIGRLLREQSKTSKPKRLNQAIQKIIYSKDNLEIRLFAGSGFAPSYEETLAFSPGSARPKMPPPIFGRARGNQDDSGRTESYGKKVWAEKNTPREQDKYKILRGRIDHLRPQDCFRESVYDRARFYLFSE